MNPCCPHFWQSINDNWAPIGGVDQFLGWCAPPGSPHDSFFSLPECRKIYRDHIAVRAGPGPA